MESVETFRFCRTIKSRLWRIAYGVLVSSLFVAGFILVMRDRLRDTPLEFWVAETLLLMFGCFFVCMTTAEQLGTSDIVVNELGLSWGLFGIVWKQMKWQDLVVIRIKSRVNKSLRNQYLEYILEPANRRRSEAFYSGDDSMKNIERLPELFVILNKYIEKYDIPVIDHRDGSERRLSKLPTSQL